MEKLNKYTDRGDVNRIYNTQKIYNECHEFLSVIMLVLYTHLHGGLFRSNHFTDRNSALQQQQQLILNYLQFYNHTNSFSVRLCAEI